MTTRQAWRKFHPETVQMLFNAVDEDDVIDEHVSLPQRIDLRCTRESLRDNYALCLQYWEEGFTRAELLNLVKQFCRGETLSEQQRMQYKYIRSRYKHLRFAQRLYSHDHTSQRCFSRTTVFLGRFQDAFRNGNKTQVAFYGRLLCFYLSTPVWKGVHYSLRHIHLDSADEFIAYCRMKITRLKVLLAKPQLSGREFHAVRKIISQQVSYYDTVRTLNPDNQEAHQISRFLAAINGLMGDRHDEMVSDNLAGRISYNATVPLDSNIRQRLDLFLERYPL